jgi:hypothetical protein
MPRAGRARGLSAVTPTNRLVDILSDDAEGR